MLPVICAHDVQHQARRQLASAEYSQQGVEDGRTPRQAEALVPPNDVTRHRHYAVTLLGYSLVFVMLLHSCCTINTAVVAIYRFDAWVLLHCIMFYVISSTYLWFSYAESRYRAGIFSTTP